MSLLIGGLESHYTQPDKALQEKRKRTWPGMAHFGGSGPLGKTCRECALWTGCGQQAGYYAKDGEHGGRIKPRPCEKYRSLMGGDVGPGVPEDAGACRYFVASDDPPARFDK
jgi:hypothetical protein